MEVVRAGAGHSDRLLQEFNRNFEHLLWVHFSGGRRVVADSSTRLGIHSSDPRGRRQNRERENDLARRAEFKRIKGAAIDRGVRREVFWAPSHWPKTHWPEKFSPPKNCSGTKELENVLTRSPRT